MSESVSTESPNGPVTTPEVTETKTAIWRDYYEITKPRVVALLVLTALVGMCLSVPGTIPWQVLIPSMVGIGFLSSAAAAINHIVDDVSSFLRVDPKQTT